MCRMIGVRRSFNPKRKLAPVPETGAEFDRLGELASTVAYGGNPEHKRSPGDFKLNPPAAPRPAKTLCDIAGITRRNEAVDYLRQGLRRGMVSERQVDGWPQNVWAVTGEGVVLEAQRDGAGSYHGYPMPSSDPMWREVFKRWHQK